MDSTASAKERRASFRALLKRLSQKAKEVVAQGYTAMKFDPFGTAWRKMTRAEEDLSIDLVAAVREAVGPYVDLAIEAHARFSVATAIQVGKRLEPMSPAWYEDPVPHTTLVRPRKWRATSRFRWEPGRA